MILPDTIDLSDTALLNAMIGEGITIDDLLASGEYKFDNGSAYFKAAPPTEAELPKAKTKKITVSADSMQGGLF